METPKFIPVEILIDIITRLPSKSLVRFSSVSKFWYSFITNPNFIATHLNRASVLPNACLMLMPAKFKNNGDNICTILSENTLIEHSSFEFPWKSNDRRICRFGNEICFCNGIICFGSRYRSSKKLYLCNPSLRKLKTLPPSCIFIAASSKFHWVFGFGVDDVSGDYKVVRIFYHTLNREAPPLVEVYSLRTNSWKSIELNIPVPPVLNLYFSSVLCNGAIHWFADADPDKPSVILCYDLCDEVFCVMELPGALSVMKRGYVFLFGALLSVFIETANENPDEGLRYEVWVMREYGVVESWTKEFIGLVEGVREREVGFTRGGKVIFRKNDGMLALLDLEDGQLVDVGFQEKSYGVADYVESLVLLEEKQLEDVADYVESPVFLEDGVSSRVQPESLSHQTDGGASSSRSAVENDDAKWIAAIHSSANEIPPNIWRAWGA